MLGKWEKLAMAGRLLMRVSWITYCRSRQPDLETLRLGKTVDSLAADTQPPPGEY